MTYLSNLGGRVGKFLSDNSPTILAATAVAGTVLTAYFTGKASMHVARRMSHHEEDVKQELDTRQQLEYVVKSGIWREYIPAITAGAVTISAIVCANRIGTRRAAALASAFTLSERAFETYKAKVAERMGPNKEHALRDEIAQEAVNQTSPSREVIITNGGEVLCCDAYSGRYFTSSVENIKQAQNRLNHELLNVGYASLSEFYYMIGLKPTSHSDEIGWKSDELLELDFSTTLTEDNKPCIYVSFKVTPIRNYDRGY